MATDNVAESKGLETVRSSGELAGSGVVLPSPLALVAIALDYRFDDRPNMGTYGNVISCKLHYDGRVNDYQLDNYEYKLELILSMHADLVAYWDNKSEWFDNHLTTLVEGMGDADIVYGGRTRNGRAFPSSPFNEDALVNGINFMGTQVVFRAGALEALRPLPQSPIDLYLKAYRAGMKFQFIDVVTYDEVV